MTPAELFGGVFRRVVVGPLELSVPAAALHVPVAWAPPSPWLPLHESPSPRAARGPEWQGQGFTMPTVRKFTAASVLGPAHRVSVPRAEPGATVGWGPRRKNGPHLLAARVGGRRLRSVGSNLNIFYDIALCAWRGWEYAVNVDVGRITGIGFNQHGG